MNQATGIWGMGSRAAAAEVAAIRRFVGLVGWDPARAGGCLTHDGSLANLTALLAARARIARDAWAAGVPSDLAVLAPAPAHPSIARAVSVLGLGRHALVKPETDRLGRVLPDRSPRRSPPSAPAGAGRWRSWHARGRPRPASTTTSPPSPTPPKPGVWLHAEGAHGAGALLGPVAAP